MPMCDDRAKEKRDIRKTKEKVKVKKIQSVDFGFV